MDLISLIIATLLGLLISLLAVLLFVAIIFNMKRGRKYRQALARKLAQLRLNRMLISLGIDVNAYIHDAHVADIYNHMERCEECSNTEECDNTLVKENIKSDEIGFCNNEQSLQKIAEAQSISQNDN